MITIIKDGSAIGDRWEKPVHINPDLKFAGWKTWSGSGSIIVTDIELYS